MSTTPRCHFCGGVIETDADEWIPEADEVVEFWSEKLQDSAVAHATCLPNRIGAVSMATAGGKS